MLKYFSLLFLFNPFFVQMLQAVEYPNTTIESAKITNGEFTTVIEGYDWGPGVSKVILSVNDSISSVHKNDFIVKVEKSSKCAELPDDLAKGERNILYAYVSDKYGKLLDTGKYISLILEVAPNLPISSSMNYFGTETCHGSTWVDYKMIITNKPNENVWNKEIGQIKPIVDKFDLTGRFTFGDITMSYASFIPENNTEKSPLIIWLHGGGEGGDDPTIPLMANRAANYASEEIQFYFDGAYVLVPQCPGAWMHNEEGIMTHGRENDIYNEALMALIKNYVSANPEIDTDRIYIGGCSNGGYMSLKLILLEPTYFAAGFISSLPYQSQYISDEKIESIKNVPIWFVHSADDKITLPELTVLPVYNRLLNAGASNVHLSYYDHVVDITGFFGGENYRYLGHLSWIYLHANKCKYDYDGKPVKLNGKSATIMEWLAAQKNNF